jgi:DNA-binding NarL/FixJ family response regulator
MNKMRLLVADDHSLFRDGIVSLLEAADFDVIGQAGNGQEAIDKTRSLKPDLVLLDIAMPGMDGFEVLRRIKAELPQIMVVMLTVSEKDEDILTAIQNGADGYLLKNLDAAHLIDMLEGLKRGEVAITRRTMSQFIREMAKADREESDQPADRLTQRESELLKLVAEGYSNRAIADHLHISENTVKYHLRNILQKLNVKNRTEAATFAILSGLIHPTPK